MKQGETEKGTLPQTGNLEVSCWKVSCAEFHDHEWAIQKRSRASEQVNGDTIRDHSMTKLQTPADFFLEGQLPLFLQ